MTGAMDRRRLLIAMAGAFGAVSLPEALRAAMGPNDKFDLLIKGGEVLDPSSGLRGVRDIGIRHGVIEAVETSIPADRALKVRRISATGHP
jgi:dihydroorotase